MQAADFSGAKFEQTADFHEAVFNQEVSFWQAIFTQYARFEETTFKQDATFAYAKFAQDVDFSYARFSQAVYFRETTFERVASYTESRFEGRGVFGPSQFLGRVDFRRTKFNRCELGAPTSFALASFIKPDEVIFDGVDLSQVSFHNCDVSRFWFTSSVAWGGRNGRAAVLVEETMSLEAAQELGLWVDDHLDCKAIAQIYQQLKKNYDNRLDYWAANEFHFGEMEMQRLDVPRSGPLLGLRQWSHPRLSLVALYRWGSSYGNSFQRPLWWLIPMLILFSLLFPMAGLSHTVGQGQKAQTWVETFGSAWGAGTQSWQKAAYLFGVWGHGMLTTMDTATFQRNSEYAPVYPWGRVLAILETLLTSTLVALFFLALRRQFRR